MAPAVEHTEDGALVSNHHLWKSGSGSEAENDMRSTSRGWSAVDKVGIAQSKPVAT